MPELDNLSWLVYKGNKIPYYKKSYCLKEGDVIKLGREWLLIKDIHISRQTRKKMIKNNNKNKTNESNHNIFLSYHSQTNQSLNLNGDFNNFEEENFMDEDKNNDSSDNEDKEKKDKIIKDTENNLANSKKKIIKKIKDINKDKSKEKEEKEKEEKNINIKDLVSNESEKDSEINGKKKNKKICRICYIEEFDKKNNPLIKPCKCAGSMKYIHYECLLHWLKTKILINKNIYNNNGFFSIYSLDLIECELCKNQLPNYIRHNNKIYSLLDLDKKFEEEKDKNKPKKSIEVKGDLNIFNKKNKESNNYIIFDSLTPGRQDNKYRYLVKFDKNNVMKIGRALEMQLILNDISVSRSHCQLKLEDDGTIILEDNNSKFGSLVLIQSESIEILRGQTLTIQVGTNYLNISIKKSSSIFGCCNVEEVDYKHSYEKINSKAIKYDKLKEVLNESITPENSEAEEDENKNIINIDGKEKEKEKEKIINGEKKEKEHDIIDKESINHDQKIWDKKMLENKNIKNTNYDSTYNGSTLFIKEIHNKEDKNAQDLKLLNIGNENENQEKKSKLSVISDNVIVSESKDNELEENNDEKDDENENKSESLIKDEEE